MQQQIFHRLHQLNMIPSVALDMHGPFGYAIDAADDEHCTSILLPPPTFMDDLAVPLSSHCPQQLLVDMCTATSVVRATVEEFGMKLNLGPKKTEAICKLRGEGTKLAREALASSMQIDEAGQKLPLLPLADGGFLRVVSAYKHLGSMAEASGYMQAEVANRTASARAATGALAKPIFKQSRLPQKVRANIARACVETRVMYDAGMWPSLPTSSWKRLDAAVMQPYRLIAGCGAAAAEGIHIATDEVRSQLSAPSARLLADEAKLRHAGRMAQHAPPGLRALLQSAGGDQWRSELRAALSIMRRMLTPLLDALPSPDADAELAVWTSYMAKFPWAWRNQVRKFRGEALQDHARYQQIAAAVRGLAADDADDSEDAEWMCGLDECFQVFQTHRALKLHQLHSHGVHKRAHRFVAGSVCPECGRDWHTRARLIWHLERPGGRQACQLALQSGAWPELDQAVIEAADESERTARRERRRAGQSELAGPPTASPAQEQHDPAADAA